MTRTKLQISDAGLKSLPTPCIFLRYKKLLENKLARLINEYLMILLFKFCNKIHHILINKMSITIYPRSVLFQ